MALRNFDDTQEAEANWLSGVLLLPRGVLAECTYKRLPKQQVIEHYGVSEDLYRYRMNVSGIQKQYRKYNL
jgi:Zn-dependent peptidase ImmA (M78 family)